MILFLTLLAQAGNDAWITNLISSLGGTGIGAAIAWYMLTRWSPNVEIKHGLQLAEQRKDLLELAASQKNLAEKIVEIFAKSQGITISDNQKAIGEATAAIKDTKVVAEEILGKLRADTTLKDEYEKAKRELDSYRHGDNRRPSRTKPGDTEVKP